MMNKYKDALEDMVQQFAYRGVSKNNKPMLYTGGMSALEGAFEALGWDDQKEFEDGNGICDVEGCMDWTVAQGSMWAETGYWCLCRKHAQASKTEPQPKMKQRAIDREKSRRSDGRLP
jgi:hypothetical protein